MIIKVYLNRKCRFIGLLLLVLLLFSCKEEKFPGYTKSKTGLYFKLHTIGGDNKIMEQDYITVDFSYQTLTDSIFYKARKTFQTTPPDYPGSIDEGILSLAKGDSASYILKALYFFNRTLKLPLPSFLDSTGYFKVNIKVNEVINPNDFTGKSGAFVAWTDNLSDYEKMAIKNFISKNNKDINWLKTPSGLHWVKTKTTEGKSVAGGDTLIIHYEGMFLNGELFDSTRKREMPFEYIVGTQWQLIKGLEQAVTLLKEGEQAIVLVPSELAFGEKGSTAGVIPPYTTVIYKLELISVKKKLKLSP